MADKVAPKVTIIGGGMITNIQILPTLYYMQSEGLIGEIGICALNPPPLIDLQNDSACAAAFPGASFTPYPDPATTGPDEVFPDL